MNLDQAKNILADIVKETAKIPKTWDEKYTDKRIMTLHPLIRFQSATAINQCLEQFGHKVRVTRAFASFEEQNKLYGYKRTRDMLERRGVNPDYAKPNESWRTNARGGESYHNYALAEDICIIEDGKPPVFEIPYEVADVFKKNGFEWLFEIMGKDKPHMQIRFGYNWRELKILPKKDGFVDLGQ